MPREESSRRPSRVILIVAALFVVIGIAIQFMRRGEGPTATPALEPEALSQAEPPNDFETPTETSRPHEPALPFEVRPTEVRRRSVETSLHNDDLAMKLAGDWQMFYQSDDYEQAVGRVAIALLDNDRIQINGEHGIAPFPNSFLIDGLYVESDEYRDENIVATYTGTFNPERTELRLSGEIRQTFNGQMYPSTMEVRIAKIDATVVDREEIIAQYKDEVSTILSALRDYARANNGEMPRSLSELVPAYLADRTLLEGNANREIVYNPNGSPLYREATDFLLEVDTSTAEGLIRGEALARNFWGDDLINPEPVLTVQFEMGEVIFHGAATIGVYAEDRDLDPTFDIRPRLGGDDEAARNAALRARCANHMKQLGLMMKMHEAEHAESRFPAGPYSVYPEYLPDPSVLTCPSVEHGTESYEFVHPAINVDEMRTLYREVTGNEAEANVQSVIPVLVETHLCAGEHGSNVLFADGHVEHISPEGFDTDIAPYLSVSLR